MVAAGLAVWPGAAAAQEGRPNEGEADRNARSAETIVVSGVWTDATSALPVAVLSGDELANRRQGGLGETLAGLPGVHLDNFGAGASRPVIRGQTVPRIEILSDGANLFDVSSVSPDHAIATEPLLLDAIEVLRGPAASIYGGNALNGAVNLIDGKIPKVLPTGGLSGGAEARYGTGDEETAVAARMSAGFGQLAVHVEGASRKSEDYAVPSDFGSDTLKDSFADSGSYSLGASWIMPKGYLGAAYSRMDSEYGLPGHSHANGVCHTHGTDLHCAAHDEFEDPFGSSDSHTAKINLRADRIDVRGDYENLLPGIAQARARLSYTDYQHNEIDGPFIFSNYTNEVYDGRLELTHAPLFGFVGTLGAQYTDATFSGLNASNLHEPFPDNAIGLVPPYRHLTENAGVFLSESRSFGLVDLELAVRKDWQTVEAPAPELRVTLSPENLANISFYEMILGLAPGSFLTQPIDNYVKDNPAVDSEPLSASIGATWNIGGGYSTALSLAHSERAPGVRELYAYGNNLAANSYEVGLTQSRRASSRFPAIRTDVLETAETINLTFRKTTGATHFELGLFHQEVEDYVFARRIETETETGIPHQYLLYVAADADFTGLDGQISHQLSEWSRITVFGDYLRADLTSEDDELPRMPPGRLGVRYEWEQGPLSADVEYYRTFDQDRIASYETETEGYNMLNATLGYRLGGDSERPLDLFLRGTNLIDELAFVHTSFVKDQSPLRGRNLVFGVRQAF